MLPTMLPTTLYSNLICMTPAHTLPLYPAATVHGFYDSSFGVGRLVKGVTPSASHTRP